MKQLNEYYPDNWVIIKIKGDDPHYKVLAGWSGGYATGDSWRMNSGITKVEFVEDRFYIFHGASGSAYRCHKDSYGLRMNNGYVWNRLQKDYGDLVEILPEGTDYSKIDWIISK